MGAPGGSSSHKCLELNILLFPKAEDFCVSRSFQLLCVIGPSSQIKSFNKILHACAAATAEAPLFILGVISRASRTDNISEDAQTGLSFISNACGEVLEALIRLLV